MRTTQQFSITLPNEMAGLVKSLVATGAYATESEVFRDGLRALMARERATERWLLEQVGPAHDALRTDREAVCRHAPIGRAAAFSGKRGSDLADAAVLNY
jgi:putative addiction module CopG family antidote